MGHLFSLKTALAFSLPSLLQPETHCYVTLPKHYRDAIEWQHSSECVGLTHSHTPLPPHVLHVTLTPDATHTHTRVKTGIYYKHRQDRV